MARAALLTADDLRLTLGRRVMLSLFDPDGVGTEDAAAVQLVLDRATARVYGHLDRVYGGEYPMPVPPHPLAVEAAREYAVGLSYLRSPEYAQRYAEKGKTAEFTRADVLCKEIADNVQRLGPTETTPAPANVGGGVYQGTTDEHPDSVGLGTFRFGFGDF